jgi:hypothetical protein
MGKHHATEAPQQGDRAPVPTPDNTPIPGGGSWHWDASIPGWVENTQAEPNAATQE